MDEEKIKMFMNDKVMSNAVYNALLDSFLKEQPSKDVQTLAASRLAIDFLKDGWKHLEHFKSEPLQVKPISKQIGV